MKSKLLLSATLIAVSFYSIAQTSSSRTYAITGKTNNNFFWSDIKQVDLATGKLTKVLYESDVTPFTSVSLDKAVVAERAMSSSNPTGYGVAACALDTRHNRLYFATMHYADISYIDLSKPSLTFTTLKKNVIATSLRAKYQAEESQITRMVIAADGYGYALSNDARHLVRFSTGNKPVVEDLGGLLDAATNKGISIHNKCTSWGGDMVADAFGKLVVISANHNVFNVDVKTKIATHTGTISGLPVNFTTNGAAVDDDGNLVVSSANVFEGLYKVNLKDFTSSKVPGKEPAFNASDLANGNLLSQKEANELMRFDIVKKVEIAGEGTVYPNPLTGSQFNVVFKDQPAGKYTILFTDIAGRALQTKVVSVSKANQVENVRLTGKTAKGMYLVKVLNDAKQLAFSEKLMIQ